MINRRSRMKLCSAVGRNFVVKKCSFWKIVTVVTSVLVTWVTLVLLNGSQAIYNFRKSISLNIHGPVTEVHVIRRPLTDIPLIDDYIVSESVMTELAGEKVKAEKSLGKLKAGNSRLDHQLQNKLVLVLVQSSKSTMLRKLHEFFAQQRIEYKAVIVGQKMSTAVLTDSNVPKFQLFVFEDYVSYLNMDYESKMIIDGYCKKFSVGIFAMTVSTESAETDVFVDAKLKMKHNMTLKQYKLNLIDLWRVAKPEAVYQDALPTPDWTIFITNHATYIPLAFSTVSTDWSGPGNDVIKSEFACVIALLDQGLLDGIRRVILGHDAEFWLNTIVAMDAITYLTNGRLGLPLERLLQVDIDDMFVGELSIRTLVKDAEAMLASQEKIRKFIPGFRYTLGFSGGYYMKGDDESMAGDQKILELRDEFVWFDHMYRHEQVHNLNTSKIRQSMLNNEKFEKEHGMKVVTDYMVTPHHSGVYPVHEPLYDLWTQERGVVYTSTEEYPRCLPTWGRRGFIHRGVMVLPRQSCRLFTHTTYNDKYVGGKTELDKSIRGGYLFKVFLQTPIMIFMSHMSNFANGQLAQYSFENVIEFVSTWTNLRLVAPSTAEIAKRYFEMYPDEISPIWTNPCDTHHHLELMPISLSCNKFPKLIIVGPQKTGTTALLSFLEAHPKFVGSFKDPDYFEEIQFFCCKSYSNGLQWYQKHFPEPSDDSIVLVEKTANYFDSDIAPKRVFSLLPRVKIVVILLEPAKRAYSWYQHVKVHNDPVATNYTFFEVVSAPDTAPKFLKDARNRCLVPGTYATHLTRWLQYFPKEQIFLIDGDQLTSDPVTVLHNIQKFVQVQPFKDFSNLLRFDEEKGFFCLTETGCFGASKGRVYPPMDPESATFLNTFFREHNTRLKTLLDDMNQPYPKWLANTP